MVRLLPARSCRPCSLRTKPRSAIAWRTRLRVASATRSGRLSTFDTVPTETPAKAARIQRSLGVLGNVNILTGAALVAVNAIIAQTNHSRPAAKRTSTARSIPLWLGAAATTTAAVVDTTRRARR